MAMIQPEMRMDQKNTEKQCFSFRKSCLTVCTYSDIGGRDTQEDSYAVAEQGGSLLAVICDGMGGCEGGALASRTAVQQLKTAFLEAEAAGADFYPERLEELDAAVYFLKDETGRRLTAGTTLVSVIVHENRLNWLAVGDSRLYIIRGQEAVQATRDHNYKEFLLNLLHDGIITEETFEEEREKHTALTSYLGMGNVKYYDLCSEPFMLQNHDVLLLASDGLYNTLDVLETVRRSNRTVSGIADSMMQALSHSPDQERDNTTFILIGYSEKDN